MTAPRQLARRHDGRHPALPQTRRARTVAAVAVAMVTTVGGHLLGTGAAPSLIGSLGS